MSEKTYKYKVHVIGKREGSGRTFNMSFIAHSRKPLGVGRDVYVIGKERDVYVGKVFEVRSPDGRNGKSKTIELKVGGDNRPLSNKELDEISEQIKGVVSHYRTR